MCGVKLGVAPNGSATMGMHAMAEYLEHVKHQCLVAISDVDRASSKWTNLTF